MFAKLILQIFKMYFLILNLKFFHICWKKCLNVSLLGETLDKQKVLSAKDIN